MKVPFVDLKAQYLLYKKEIDQAIFDVLDKTQFIGGKDLDDFSLNLSSLLNVKHSLPVANGTDAIYIALKMLGIKSGDEVITSAHTWISSAETISQVGARPVFVDTNQYYCLDEEKIESAISDKTKAILPVHLYGHAADMDAINNIASKYNLYVIEDCAQAILTQWEGKLVGSFGDAGTISFFPGKNLGAYGDAGGIITNNTSLFYNMKKFANHGSLEKHAHEIEGINSRMDNLQAAILNVKIKYLNSWIEKRREAAEEYLNQLQDIDDISLPKCHKSCHHTYHLFVIKTKERDELAKFLNDEGISTGVHYPKSLPQLDCYKYLNPDLSKYPNSINSCQTILSIPIFPEITIDQINYVVKSIKKFFSKT